jgi:hypothetical protein
MADSAAQRAIARLAERQTRQAERESAAVATKAAEIVWANDHDGCFQLSDGSWGNPGCDVCGEKDAVAKLDGKYVCWPHVSSREVMTLLNMLDHITEQQQNRS